MRSRGLLYGIMLALVASALAAGSSMIYANRAARQAEARAVAVARETERVGIENDRRWCTVLGRLTSTYNDPASPPRTELGRQIAEDFRVLLASLGCPPG